MRHNLTILALASLMAGSSIAASGQSSPAVPEDAAAEIAGQLRSFYFNLAHHDWDALTADILAAKVVAHRPAPETLIVSGGDRKQSDQSSGVTCSGPEDVSVRQAVITLEGDWAEAIVPHCPPASGRDEFRLIKFNGRWRFVAIHLFRQPGAVTVQP